MAEIHPAARVHREIPFAPSIQGAEKPHREDFEPRKASTRQRCLRGRPRLMGVTDTLTPLETA